MLRNVGPFAVSLWKDEDGDSQQDAYVLPTATKIRIVSTAGAAEFQGRTHDRAWDGDTATYYDGNDSGAWIQANFAEVQVCGIKYWPKTGREDQMPGGEFHGIDAAGGETLLHTIADADPAADAWTSHAVEASKRGPYVALKYSTAQYSTVAEIWLTSCDAEREERLARRRTFRGQPGPRYQEKKGASSPFDGYTGPQGRGAPRCPVFCGGRKCLGALVASCPPRAPLPLG